ncbi:MAG: hypothetical protein ACC656_08680 [Candidatus Heimdallarchaeota archaeon]
MKRNVEKIDPERLKASKRQALYNQNIKTEKRVSIAMKHIESLRNIRRYAKRVKNERI